MKNQINSANSANVNSSSVNNKKQLNATAAAARNDIKSMSVMYYVNQLNKLARKNEFIEGTNIKDLGKMLQQHTGEKDLFTARCFTKDINGRPCTIATYKGNVTPVELMHGEIVTDKGNELRLSEDGENVVMFKPVQMSLTGLITAYKAILMPLAAAADKAAREQQREQRKAANKSAAAARKAIREQQKQAIEDYRSGKIDINKFAEIMAIAC